MSGEIGGIAFVAATGVLGLWVVLRWPWHPSSLRAVIAHTALALAALRLAFVVVPVGSPAWWRFTGLLVIVIPALIYAWLAAAWSALFLRTARRNGIG